MARLLGATCSADVRHETKRSQQRSSVRTARLSYFFAAFKLQLVVCVAVQANRDKTWGSHARSLLGCSSNSERFDDGGPANELTRRVMTQLGLVDKEQESKVDVRKRLGGWGGGVEGVQETRSDSSSSSCTHMLCGLSLAGDITAT